MLIVLVHNDGIGTQEIANYDYEVRINHEVIEHGRIENHNRRYGWQALIREIADRHQTSTVNNPGNKEQ